MDDGSYANGDRPRPKRAVSTKLYVSSLPDTCKRNDLLALFQRYGEVVECDIVKNYAFVHYNTATEAKAAVENLNGYEFEGKNISVELSHSRVRQKPGMGDKNECFRCGRDGHWSRDCPKRGPGAGRRDMYPRRDPYARPVDPYPDDYYRSDRYLPPPPPPDRYRPYADPYRRPPPPRDYYRDYADPYARPPPDYYRSRSPPRYRDPYYERDYLPPPAPLRRTPASAEGMAAEVPPARRPTAADFN